MNRNVLKIIAFVAMLIDHIGRVFFPENVIFCIIGRVSFPIFAFFIAEGYYYTRNKLRYVVMLVACLVVSWIPFVLLFDKSFFTANVIGVFTVAVLGMFIIDGLKLKGKDDRFIYVLMFITYCLFVIVCDFLSVIPEGFLGVLLVLSFYLFRGNTRVRLFACSIILLLFGIVNHLNGWPYQYFALIAIILIAFYNQQKGKYNLKYLFYVGYPLHLIVFLVLKLLF